MTPFVGGGIGVYRATFETSAHEMPDLGALAAAVRLFPDETLLTAIGQTLGGKQGLREMNERAFAAGARIARAQANASNPGGFA